MDGSHLPGFRECLSLKQQRNSHSKSWSPADGVLCDGVGLQSLRTQSEVQRNPFKINLSRRRRVRFFFLEHTGTIQAASLTQQWVTMCINTTTTTAASDWTVFENLGFIKIPGSYFANMLDCGSIVSVQETATQCNYHAMKMSLTAYN